MSDYLTLPQQQLALSFHRLFYEQLECLGTSGIMPSQSASLSKLLCSCYSRDRAHSVGVRDAYEKESDARVVRGEEGPSEDQTVEIKQDDEALGKGRQGTSFCSSPLRTSKADLSGVEMALIATVHPYSSSAGASTRSRKLTSNSSPFRIEDVTDDPEYSHYGCDGSLEEEKEGALVEYCRLDKKRQPAAPNVCDSSTVVTATPITSRNLRSTVAALPRGVNSSLSRTMNCTTQRAAVNDIVSGQPCRGCSECHIGFREHPWRKVCVHCKCEKNEHEIGKNQAGSVYERLGVQPPEEMPAAAGSEKADPVGSVSHGYAWVPPGLSRKKVEEYMSQLPNHLIPRNHSVGEQQRDKQLLSQLPRQDLSAAYCRHLNTPQEKKVYDEFVNARNEIALDIGYVNPNVPKPMECNKCRGVLEKNEMAVIAPKLGENSGWHPACFTCATCEQLLVDLTYCVREGQLYCERHYAELHKPRCSACDELIFSGEYTKAMNKDWHSEHFCCWQCDKTLTGQRYIMRDEQPYCIKCYEDVFANQCDECSKPIGIDSKDLSYKEKHWHEQCFLCNMCKMSLVDMPFGSKNDRIFCSNCYDQAFATRCDGCNEIFRAGMKKMEYKGKQWHDKCFCCALCKQPIGTKSFIPKNEDIYCSSCYEDKFATRCCKCKKVISTGGVTYKNEPWHRECFCCSHCNSSLAGQRFTSKDDKPYCANCYGELFAKRCNACTKPITGIGGAKFISFEDRHWHNDCFICAQCTTSLVGKGFITDGTDILCPECAKARLMASNS